MSSDSISSPSPYQLVLCPTSYHLHHYHPLWQPATSNSAVFDFSNAYVFMFLSLSQSLVLTMLDMNQIKWICHHIILCFFCFCLFSIGNQSEEILLCMCEQRHSHEVTQFIEWVCVLCDHCIHNEWLNRSFFFLAKYHITQSWLSQLRFTFDSLWFLAFPKVKIFIATPQIRLKRALLSSWW